MSPGARRGDNSWPGAEAPAGLPVGRPWTCERWTWTAAPGGECVSQRQLITVITPKYVLCTTIWYILDTVWFYTYNYKWFNISVLIVDEKVEWLSTHISC